MSAIEKVLEQDVMIAHSTTGGRLFRNNTGTGWAGDKYIKMDSESLMIKNPRPLRAGLVNGSSDTIGWTPVKVTPEMVGKTLPVFTAFEMKAPKGRVSEDQKIFIGNVKEAGGIVGVIRSIEDYRREMKEWLVRIISM